MSSILKANFQQNFSTNFKLIYAMLLLKSVLFSIIALELSYSTYNQPTNRMKSMLKEVSVAEIRH